MNTISRHDNTQRLLEIVESFLIELKEQFEPTEEYNKYKFYLDDSFDEVFRITNILKEKAQ